MCVVKSFLFVFMTNLDFLLVVKASERRWM